METKQSSANPASAGRIVNLTGKHAGALIKDTPAFPEGASPDVFRKNSRAVKKWLKNVSVRVLFTTVCADDGASYHQNVS